MKPKPDRRGPPRSWAESLARSKARIEAGETVPLESVLDRLRTSAARSEALWASELPDEVVQALGHARMDPRHEHLNALMDDESPGKDPAPPDDPI